MPQENSLHAQHKAGSDLSEDASIPFDGFSFRNEHVTKLWPTELEGEGSMPEVLAVYPHSYEEPWKEGSFLSLGHDEL